MNNFSRYNAVILGFLGILALVLFSVAAYIQPGVGDLTRVGGYLENHFGWKAPQEKFPESLFHRVQSIDEYRKYYDVVVLGDSFSRRDFTGWQNYLVNETGLSVITFDIQRTTLTEILESEAFKATPPLVFIYSSIERGLWARNSECEDRSTPERSGYSTPREPVRVSPLSKPTELRYPEQRRQLSKGVDLDAAAHFLIKAAARKLGMNISKTEMLELNIHNLFSNEKSHLMLITDEDLWLKSLKAGNIATMRCSLVQKEHAVESNGKTTFLVLAVPDKLSAYDDYLVDQRHANAGIIARLAEDQPFSMPRVDLAIENAIRNGVVDVYLPDDTHWGPAGFRIAAQSIIDFLIEDGVVQYDPPDGTGGDR